MNLRELFKKAENELENSGEKPELQSLYECPNCKSSIDRQEARANYNVCPVCGQYFHIGARKRIFLYADRDSFRELFSDYLSVNPIGFPGYEEKLDRAREKSGEKEGVVCGTMSLDGKKCAIFSMDAKFMMGSMGTVVGEKITLLFEYAVKERLPVIGITVSGGARMQEGMLSLMQMAKVSGAVKRHSDAGLLYMALLTNPTTGGVCASFAMEADIILAEPKALIGFAGPRVIQQTMKKKLPKDFQRAETLLSCGFVDEIVERGRQKEVLSVLLSLHQEVAECL